MRRVLRYRLIRQTARHWLFFDSLIVSMHRCVSISLPLRSLCRLALLIPLVFAQPKRMQVTYSFALGRGHSVHLRGEEVAIWILALVHRPFRQSVPSLRRIQLTMGHLRTPNPLPCTRIMDTSPNLSHRMWHQAQNLLARAIISFQPPHSPRTALALCTVGTQPRLG